jgi:hypothetical protein
MDSLYNIPLSDILRKINIYDLYAILKTPELRNLLKTSVNFKQLEKDIILNCIDDMERKLNTNLFYELLDEYFIPKGYNEEMVKNSQVYQDLMEEFFDHLLEFEDFDDEIVSKIEEMKENGSSLSEVSDFLGYWLESYSELRNLYLETEQKMDTIMSENIEKFKKSLFEGYNSYQNVKEYLNVVIDYVENYVESDDEEVSVEFYNCVNKIEKIKKVFEKAIVPNKKKIMDLRTKAYQR